MSILFLLFLKKHKKIERRKKSKKYKKVFKKVLTNTCLHIIMNRLSRREQFACVGMDVVHIYGGIAQLARVLGSYPIGRRFESHCRYQINKPYLPRWFYKRAFEPLIYGPVVKRLRHRPFTAVTRVRFSSGSPQSTCRDTGAFFFLFIFSVSENRTQSSIFRRFAPGGAERDI